MSHRTIRSVWYTFVCLICLTALSQTAQAGPPLICHPYEIGAAQSLPWGGKEWRAVKPDYELNRLVEDSLALLQPDTPVIVRMETLRRAAIYAIWAGHDREVGYRSKDSKVAHALLARLLERAEAAKRKGGVEALALFDAGYFIETWKQAAPQQNAPQADGYALVKQASSLRGGDATMEFAAALMTRDRIVQRAHLQKALAGAPEGSLLARNLTRHFGHYGDSLTALRASLATAQQ